MALVLADRVRETTTTAGTGTITLLGAVPSCQSFAAVGNGNTTYYTIVAYSGTEWEVGIGTYTSAGTTLSRDTVLSSSNSGSLVNFSAGTKDVFVDYPAGRAVYEDAAGNVDGYPITGGTINNTTIGATTPNTGVFTTLTATGQTSLGGAAGSEGLRVVNTTSSINYVQVAGSAASVFTTISNQGADPNIGMQISTKGIGAIRFNTDVSAQQFRVAHTASAVNYVQVTGAATTAAPVISVQGSDANVAFGITSKGTSAINLLTNGGNQRQVQINHAASAVNYLTLTGSAASSAPVLAVAGTDTNISWAVQSKGTGAIDLAAGSSGVNISNGGTVTAITRTAAGSGYTTIPSVVISAPTTAGGVQATATAIVQIRNTSGVTINSGGTGYTVNDVLTFSGGTGTAATLTVATVSGGVITSITLLTSGGYSALPTFPASVTGGTGTGATFTFTDMSVSATPTTITNAGSGYVEQPTVTFSGGGGSGAAAYATVGSGSVIRALGATGSQSLSFFMPGGEGLRIRDTGGSADTYPMISPSSALTTFVAQGNANASMFVGANGSGSVRFSTNGTSVTEQLRVSHTASAVNYVQVTGAATGSDPTYSAQGSDSNISLRYLSKGAGEHRFATNTASNIQFRVLHGGSSVVNYSQVYGGATGLAPVISSAGSDTNISQVFQSKGTGAIDLAAGSSGVNISNGGTVTAITRTANGTGYTSIPSVAITAPTTAGGVQATASVNLFANTATVASGGTGYTNGNVLTVVGGTGGPATYTVTGQSAGAVTSVTPLNFGSYSALPTNPVSVTGGSGSSATLNLTYGISTPTITNAGSGYVEQPTVTFSGGGGSGAAAYASVGSGTVVRTLGSTLSFTTGGGEQVRVTDGSGTSTGYLKFTGSTLNSNGVYLTSSANAMYLSASAGNNFRFFTNGEGIAEQLRVAHTASAVNYVQVTGAATGNNPVLSSQGSDTNIGMRFYSKGAVGLSFWTSGGSSRQFQVEHTGGSVVNYAFATGSVAGSGPIFSVAGSDTNIDLNLTPKGTGNVRFGTYTGTALSIAGYIEIKDSGGTVRKLAVVA